MSIAATSEKFAIDRKQLVSLIVIDENALMNRDEKLRVCLVLGKQIFWSVLRRFF